MRFLLALLLLPLGVFAGEPAILSMQKDSLQKFVVEGAKYKDLSDMLNKSPLHWRPDFDKVQKSAKGLPVPKILSTKNGIELVGEGKKISLEATGKLFTYLINGREFNVEAPVNLLPLITSLEKFVKSDGKSARFGVFPEAHADGGLSAIMIALGVIAGTALLDATWKIVKVLWGSSVVYCGRGGDFSIAARGDLGDKSVIHYNGKDFGSRGFKDGHEILSDLRKSYGADEEAYKKAVITINAELKSMSDYCKKNPGLEYWWSKTQVEKTMEGIKGQSLRSSE